MLDVAPNRERVVVGHGQAIEVEDGRGPGLDEKLAAAAIAKPIHAVQFAPSLQRLDQFGQRAFALTAHDEIHAGMVKCTGRIERGVDTTQHHLHPRQHPMGYVCDLQGIGQRGGHGGHTDDVRRELGQIAGQRLAIHDRSLHVEQGHAMATRLQRRRQVGQPQGWLEGGDVEVAALDPFQISLEPVAKLIPIEEGRVDKDEVLLRHRRALLEPSGFQVTGIDELIYIDGILGQLVAAQELFRLL